MPIRKKPIDFSKKQTKTGPQHESKGCCGNSADHPKPMHKHFGCMFCKKLFITFLLIIMAYLIVWIGTLIRNNIKEYNHIGLEDKFERTITLSAVGEATVSPDIATVSLGMVAEGETVEEAQAENSEVMNALIAGLKSLGIEEGNIKTENYYSYPKYDYSEGGDNEIIGHRLSQNVNVKIRNLDNTETVLALAGELGVNNIGGLDFTTDNTETYIEEARMDALQKVYKKARVLADALGVRLVGITSYDEYSAGAGVVPLRAFAMDEAMALGGGAPDIEPGTNEVKLNVSVTFEFR